MSGAIVTLFVVALTLVAVLTWGQASFSSMDSGAQAWKQMADVAEEVSRTDISIADVQKQGAFWEVYVQNTGGVHLARFTHWDVIAHYYDNTGDYYISRLTYIESGSPGDQEWTVETIYSDDSLVQEEVFEPGILNPGEVMMINLKLVPTPGGGTTNWVIVSSDNGVAASAQFNG